MPNSSLHSCSPCSKLYLKNAPLLLNVSNIPGCKRDQKATSVVTNARPECNHHLNKKIILPAVYLGQLYYYVIIIIITFLYNDFVVILVIISPVNITTIDIINSFDFDIEKTREIYLWCVCRLY